MTDQHPLRPPLRKQTGVPRRFGVGVMLVITTMYALLFALLKGLHFSPLVFVTVALFFTLVGLAQAVLFKGRNPRRASTLAGVVLCTLLMLAGGIVDFRVGGGRPRTWQDRLVAIIFDPTAYVLSGFGALPGYLAGGLIAGVFLFLNKVQPPLEDPVDEKPADGTEQGAPGVRRGNRPAA